MRKALCNKRWLRWSKRGGEGFEKPKGNSTQTPEMQAAADLTSTLRPTTCLESHTCQYCQSVVVRDRWNQRYSSVEDLEIAYIENAIASGCVLFRALFEKLIESGNKIESLLPRPSLYQDWTQPVKLEDGHVKMHLSRGEKRLCKGALFRFCTVDSEAVSDHGNLIPVSTWNTKSSQKGL
jgi:hypothetical protein